MAEQYQPAKPLRESESVYIYRLEPVSKLPIVVGKVFIDTEANAWVRINKDDLAEGIGVTDIDGVALMSRGDFEFHDQNDV